MCLPMDQHRAVGLGLIAFLYACGSRTGLLYNFDGSSGSASATDDSSGDDTIQLADGGSNQGCSDGGGSTVPIYLIDDTNTLLAYAPASGTISPIGLVNCPTDAGPYPIAFAIDQQQRVGYLIYSESDGDHSYHFDTNSLTCVSVGTDGIVPMDSVAPSTLTFVATKGSGQETLYDIENPKITPPAYLISYVATIDPTTFVDTLRFRTLGTDVTTEVPPCDVRPESCSTSSGLFGDGAGHLYGTWSVGGELGPHVFNIDTATGAWSPLWQTLSVDSHNPTATATIWGGDVYLFTGAMERDITRSAVLRYCPRGPSYSLVATWDHSVILAATPTSAPTD